ncbi:uncharacterized protein LOC122014274 isoform X1 [Zingiber officinale]|uniref:uncharacterized protein LOC122014274 isoform X1 n=1 Tax=Zingiber officinale TaxID=94328 RepID=UPI001C4C35EB|nr:uncharacterized protein LOC122014274 isoform X1 [Zingiber officinale]
MAANSAIPLGGQQRGSRVLLTAERSPPARRRSKGGQNSSISVCPIPGEASSISVVYQFSAEDQSLRLLFTSDGIPNLGPLLWQKTKRSPPAPRRTRSKAITREVNRNIRASM